MRSHSVAPQERHKLIRSQPGASDYMSSTGHDVPMELARPCGRGGRIALTLPQCVKSRLALCVNFLRCGNADAIGGKADIRRSRWLRWSDANGPRGLAEWESWNVGAARIPTLLRLDVGRPDHLAPLFCLLDDNLVEFSRRARKRRCAQVSEPRRDLGIGEPRIDLFVELVDDLDGRVPRSSDPNPRAGLEAWLELGKRWNFRQCVPARCTHDREGTQFARPDVLDRCRQIIDGSLYLPAEQVSDHGGGATIRHVHHFNADRHLEQFAGYLRDRAGPKGGQADLARICLDVRNQLGDGRDRERGMYLQDERRPLKARDHGDVANKIEPEIGVERGVHRVRRDSGEKRVTIGRRPDNRLRRDVGGGTWPVLDDEWLA